MPAREPSHLFGALDWQWVREQFRAVLRLGRRPERRASWRDDDGGAHEGRATNRGHRF